MKNLFLSIALAMSATVAQAAPGYLYDCDMSYVKQGKGWVSPKIAFVLPGDGTVKIVDAITLQFNKEPLAGTIVRENDKRLVIKWTIDNARADSGKTFNNFQYRASISKSSGGIELTLRPGHYDAGLRSPRFVPQADKLNTNRFGGAATILRPKGVGRPCALGR